MRPHVCDSSSSLPEHSVGVAVLTLATPTAAAQWIAGYGGVASPARWTRFARRAGWLLGFAILLLGWQIALFFAFFDGLIQLAAFAGIHVFGCLALAALPTYRLRRAVPDPRDSAALQMVGWSAFAGPFGAFVATALAFPITRIVSRIESDTDALATDRSAIERVERLHGALLDRRVRLEGASRIRPLMDMIAEGSRAEKLEALRVVYQKYEAGLSTVLNRALRDPDNSVRVLTATVIAKLNAKYSRDIGDRQREAAASPELAQNWRALAETRLAYAQSGLLDPPQAQAQIELSTGDVSRAAGLDLACGGPPLLLEKGRRRVEAFGR
jgi:hypothetical protein